MYYILSISVQIFLPARYSKYQTVQPVFYLIIFFKNKEKWNKLYTQKMAKHFQHYVTMCYILIPSLAMGTSITKYKITETTALWLFRCLQTAFATWQGKLSLGHLVMQLGQTIWLCHFVYQFVTQYST